MPPIRPPVVRVRTSWRALAGLALGLRYNRRRLRARYGLEAYYGVRCIGGTDPWRQMVLLCLAASVFLSSNPQAVYAGTPDYDPVFYYYHPDHLGSSQLMTDRDGDVVQHYGYSPFGRENYQNNTYAFSVSNRYTGQTLDEDTDLYYYGARCYDPELARFIQADSTIPDPEFSQAYNRYAYVYNNPLRFSDPTGQDPLLIAAIIGAIMGAASAAAAGGNLGDILKGALIGAITGAISAGIAEAVGQMITVASQSAVVGSVAGAIAGFGASYAMRGIMSGDWHFTIIDATNLAIAIWAACLEDPSPGADSTVEQQDLSQKAATNGSQEGTSYEWRFEPELNPVEASSAGATQEHVMSKHMLVADEGGGAMDLAKEVTDVYDPIGGFKEGIDKGAAQYYLERAENAEGLSYDLDRLEIGKHAGDNASKNARAFTRSLKEPAKGLAKDAASVAVGKVGGRVTEKILPPARKWWDIGGHARSIWKGVSNWWHGRKETPCEVPE